MKITLLCITFLLALIGNAQTSVVTVKSHHGDMTELPNSEDKFGIVMPAPVYDTLIRMSDDCVVQIGSQAHSYRGAPVRFRNTICQHWYYQKVAFDKEAIQEFHGGNITLIGFEESGGIRKKQSPFFKKRAVKQSSKWLALIIALSVFGTYLASPKLFNRQKS